MVEEADPVLSVVIAVVSDTLRPTAAEQLRPCLRSLAQQISPPAMEIIVPHLPNSAAVTELKREFPDVRFLAIADLKRFIGRPGNREHHNELRARGMSAARGAIVALTDDCSRVDAHWCAQIVRAHEAPVAGVGGAIELGGHGWLNSALYFCDFGRYQMPLHEGDTLIASDANVSYKRSALNSIEPVWRDSFEEITANLALRARGERVILSSNIVVYAERLGLDLRSVARERFIFGKSFGSRRGPTGAARLVWTGLCAFLPAFIVARIAAIIIRKGRNRVLFFKALPVIAVLMIAWCMGEATAYATGTRTADNRPLPEAPAASPSRENFRLSAVLVVVEDGVPASDTAGLIGVLDALRRQTTARPFEIIVPLSDATLLAKLQRSYPEALFIPAQPASPPGSSERVQELRAIGVAAARGDLVAVTEDHVRPDPDWVAEVMKAHRQGYAAIGGAVENGLDHVLNWATYFADLGRYHNPLPAGQSGYASVVNVSYRREPLMAVNAVWKQRFHETEVHTALMAGGEKLALAPGIIVRQYRPEVKFGSSLREFYSWGRSYGGSRAKPAGPAKRFLYAGLTPLVPGILLLRSGMNVVRKKRLLLPWLKSLPVGVALTLAWTWGELTGYVTGEANGPLRNQKGAEI
jgi:hypothetical protein